LVEDVFALEMIAVYIYDELDRMLDGGGAAATGRCLLGGLRRYRRAYRRASRRAHIVLRVE
jgi:hypothetical protein